MSSISKILLVKCIWILSFDIPETWLLSIICNLSNYFLLLLFSIIFWICTNVILCQNFYNTCHCFSSIIKTRFWKIGSEKLYSIETFNSIYILIITYFAVHMQCDVYQHIFWDLVETKCIHIFAIKIQEIHSVVSTIWCILRAVLETVSFYPSPLFLPYLRHVLSRLHQQSTDWIMSSSAACQLCIIHTLVKVIIQRHIINLSLLLVLFKNSLQAGKISKSSVCNAKSFIIWLLINTPISSYNSLCAQRDPLTCLLIWIYHSSLSTPWCLIPPCLGIHCSFCLENILFPLPFTLRPTIIYPLTCCRNIFIKVSQKLQDNPTCFYFIFA